MKILYGIQATGNGHLARAREIIPALAEKTALDVFISGTQGDLALSYPVTFQKHGLSFVFGKSGKVNVPRTIHSLRPIRLWKDIRQCPVEKYDLIVHDFEPITAYAAKRKGIPNISLSHQASFFYSETPRPKKSNPYAEWILRNYAPSKAHLGLHFDQYHPSILTPVIRKEVRNLKPEIHDHVVVYLPAYCPYYLCSILQKLATTKWKIFSKHVRTPFIYGNTEIYPVDTQKWLEELCNCRAVILGAGFEGPAESLFLGKKLLVIPMTNQYEQKCNAAALLAKGVRVLDSVSLKKIGEIGDWLDNGRAQSARYPDNTKQIVDHILKVS